MQAEEIKPPEGYDPPETFPNCCGFHKKVLESTKSWFEKFPRCCESHRQLLTANWFDKTNYLYVERKVVDQLSYTEHIIDKKFDNSDWYEDITDYIEYNYASFGSLPYGFGQAPGLVHYLDNILYILNTSTSEKLTSAPEKTKKLLQFVSNYYKPPGKEKTDFNQLHNIYQNWLKIFPFNIRYFREIKITFERQFPILKGMPTRNRYSGI